MERHDQVAMLVVKKATGQIGAQGKVSLGVTPVALKATTRLKCVDGKLPKWVPRPGADPKAGEERKLSTSGARRGHPALQIARPWQCA